MTVGLFGDSKLSKLAQVALSRHSMNSTVKFFTQEYTDDPNITLNEANLKAHKIHSFFLGSIGYKAVNMKETIYTFLKNINMPFQELIDKDAYVPGFGYYEIGIGNWIMEHSKIQPLTKIGDFNTFWPGSILSHDSIVGDFNWISPGAIICGEVEIGSHNFIGAGAIITPGTKIGNGRFIKAGTIAFPTNKVDEVVQEGYTNLIDKSNKTFWERT